MSTVLAWHFVAEDRRVQYDGPHKVTVIEVGQTLTESRPLRICSVGLHASERLIDALKYAPGPVLCRVELAGTILRDTDKLCAEKRTVLAMADITGALHGFACDVAEEALLNERAKGREPDARSWAAIETKRRWVRGEASDSELCDARSAAWSAESAAESVALSAAWSAWSAAESAAESAAWSAARSAAWSAAESAAWSAQNKRLAALILSLPEFAHYGEMEAHR